MENTDSLCGSLGIMVSRIMPISTSWFLDSEKREHIHKLETQTYEVCNFLFSWWMLLVLGLTYDLVCMQHPDLTVPFSQGIISKMVLQRVMPLLCQAGCFWWCDILYNQWVHGPMTTWCVSSFTSPWSEVMLCGILYQWIKYFTSLWRVVLVETSQASKTNLYSEYLFLSVKMNLYPFKGRNRLK